MSLCPPEELATARLRLRKLQLTDAPAIYANWATDVEVTRFLAWPPHTTQRKTEALLVTALAGWLDGREFNWGMVDRSTAELVGSIALVHDNHRLELGATIEYAPSEDTPMMRIVGLTDDHIEAMATGREHVAVAGWQGRQRGRAAVHAPSPGAHAPLSTRSGILPGIHRASGSAGYGPAVVCRAGVRGLSQVRPPRARLPAGPLQQLPC